MIPPDAYPVITPYVDTLADLVEFAIKASRKELKRRSKKFGASRKAKGDCLHPGDATPLWNEMRKRLRFHTLKHGEKAILARQMGLSRQRIHKFLKEESAMPDAERTLWLLAWLDAKEHGREPPI